VVAEGIEAGEGARGIRQRITNEFTKIEKVQASAIARTETIWAFNEGAVQGYIQSGVVSGKQWWAANDDRTCMYCSSMHGEIIGVERNFFNKGEDGVTPDGDIYMSPYEDIGHPPLHTNCRCTIVPVLI
jgi:SPP1 gp7 family putative phage head morphogenesis protein